MTTEVSRYLLKLAKRLFPDVNEQDAFMAALSGSSAPEPALIWMRDEQRPGPFKVAEPLSWQPDFSDRIKGDERPGASSMHEEGEYYCMDLSSIFQAAPAHAVHEPCDSVLDVCASPGGKSVYYWRVLKPEFLICNEAVKNRVRALISNLKRCRIAPAAVASLSAPALAERFPNAFELVIVDAPCSGQSLLAKGASSPGCFHPSTVNMNANRQKKIIANAASCTAPGGYLAYSTCTFSREENEGVVEWFLRKFPRFESLPLCTVEPHRSPLSDYYCYRLYPQQHMGAGGFTALFKDKRREEKTAIRLDDHQFWWSTFNG
ncbi:MAG: RsmB/NOP family class I SAM-dependent RNA methyltransferase [Deltaproteobacteria bacterium]|nr:RsmB/NOP family class I SAM-dependent RNA methyltransferase [Deltaproteobacteria bacterium]